MIKSGIGQGCAVWGTHSPDKRCVLKGGIVISNLITRDLNWLNGPPDPSLKPRLGEGRIGYGFPVGSDVANWTCRGNESHDNVLYIGEISGTLPKYINASPGPFVHDAWGNYEGDECDEESLDLQKEFVQGKVWGLIEIGVGESKVLAYDGGALRLGLGESIKVRGVEVVFRPEDAELCVRRCHDDGRTGRTHWEGGVGGRLNHRRHEFSNMVLVFTESGKLMIVNSNNPQEIYWDFAPSIPPSLPPTSTPRPNVPRLALSSENPHVSIASSSGDVLFASAYTFPGADLSVGKFISRPTPEAGGSLIWSLSPQRQIVVAHTHAAVQCIEWPLDHRFQILSKIGNEGEGANDTGAALTLQGDGNLVSGVHLSTFPQSSNPEHIHSPQVIYTGEGSPTWGSNTCEDGKRAKSIRYGVGSQEEPFLELLNDQGVRVWSQ